MQLIHESNNYKKNRTMARPIRETPILYGKDAERFVERMKQVERMSEEERKANREECRKAFEELITEVNLVPRKSCK